MHRLNEPLSCPLCHTTLTPVSRNQDYFCPCCMAAVCVEGPIAHVYRPETGARFSIATEQL